MADPTGTTRRTQGARSQLKEACKSERMVRVCLCPLLRAVVTTNPVRVCLCYNSSSSTAENIGEVRSHQRPHTHILTTPPTARPPAVRGQEQDHGDAERGD